MTVIWSNYITEEPEIVDTADLVFNTIQTTFENKKKQYASKSDTPVQTWTLRWDSLDEDTLNNIFNFYVARKGEYEAFYWYHPYEKTTLTANENGNTVLHVAQTMRVLVGDIIRIGPTEVYTVDSIQDSAKTITVTGAVGAEAVSGAAVQIRYTVRCVTPLTYETLKAWLYKIGLTFERNMA